jgi:hypothetical protein
LAFVIAIDQEVGLRSIQLTANKYNKLPLHRHADILISAAVAA